jgi:hypothetical protein
MCNNSDNIALANAVVTELARQHETTLEQMRKIAPIVDEYQYAATDTKVTVHPQTHNLEKITCILAYVQYVSTTATLTLGDRTLPIPAGLTKLDNVGFLLRERDKRTLVSDSATAGIISLELFGEVLPEFGVI